MQKRFYECLLCYMQKVAKSFTRSKKCDFAVKWQYKNSDFVVI